MRRFLTLLLLSGAALPALADDAPMVNYVSADGVYVNVGRYAGVVPGTRIAVLRDGKRIAVLEAVHVSSHSASCRIVEKTSDPRAGDAISFTRSKTPPPAPESSAVTSPEASDREDRRPRRRGEPSRLRGYVALQNMWIEDMSGSGLTSLQPAVSGRLVASNIMGTTGSFFLRLRSRLYYRPEPNESVWSHRVTELAVRFGDPEYFTWGVGRMVVDDVHGLGYIDGAAVTVHITPQYRAGIIAGFDPFTADMRFDPSYRKFGTFLTWQTTGSSRSRLALTGALSGSYVDGTINREFGYVQGVYSYGNVLHVYQSMEVDLNRQWREAANGGRLTFSNFLTSITATPTERLVLDFGYDARQNYRDMNTFETPDSLFDDNTYTGWNAGATYAVNSNVSLRANGGLRYRGSSEQTNRYYSLSSTIHHLPMRGQHLTLRWAASQTQMVTGYRPSANLRFPLGRRLRMKAGIGGYIYSQENLTSKTFFAEGGAYYTFMTRYYASADLRQYVGGNLESFQLFTEVGVNF
jgi:hypothetical protein